MMDPARKESILGDLRIAKALVLERRPDLGLQVLRIALERMKGAKT